MSKIIEPADQLAAIEMVWELALAAELNGSKVAETMIVLRSAATAQQERDVALGRAFLDAWHEHLDAAGMREELGAEPTPTLAGLLVRVALASVGAQAAYVAEPASMHLDPFTTPAQAQEGIDNGSRSDCSKNPSCILVAPHQGPCMSTGSTATIAAANSATVSTVDCVEFAPAAAAPTEGTE
jgi:hypothetical protein